jgi:hypothetical protein
MSGCLLKQKWVEFVSSYRPTVYAAAALPTGTAHSANASHPGVGTVHTRYVSAEPTLRPDDGATDHLHHDDAVHVMYAGASKQLWLGLHTNQLDLQVRGFAKQYNNCRW